MYKRYTNANFHLPFFIRHHFWPLFISALGILLLAFCPQTTEAIQNNDRPNPDRTIAKLGPRELQHATTLSSLPISVSSVSSSSTKRTSDDLLHVLYVITLDGKITAIDAHENGRQLWIADTGAPLVDSSLSKIEISRESRSVRLIPSLIGGLYEKYDEDGHVEPLPFDADALLDASFKLHDELVITGGKHIDTLGLDLRTGQILYSFSTDDAKQRSTQDSNRTTKTTENNDSQATLVVKRTTQTVRARSARSGFEKWNFSVSNSELLHLRVQPSTIVLGKVDEHSEHRTAFSGHFEYQLQTGAVLAFDESDRPIWSSMINSPIAAVWELKDGQLNEKSLFESTARNSFRNDDPEEDDSTSPQPISRRLAFIGEFNSTPYVLVSSRVQKELIYEARKTVGGVSNKRPVLSTGHKAYQKRTLSIGSEARENTYQRAIGVSAPDHNFPLALRPDPSGNHRMQQLSSSTDETCDTSGYLEIFLNPSDILSDHNESDNSNEHGNSNSYGYLKYYALMMSSVILGAIVIILVWYKVQKHKTDSLQQTTIVDNTDTTTVTAAIQSQTPEYHQIEHSLIPPFESRYSLEYEHVRFLGRGGFGVVFEAINKLDERRVAIKRVSLKKASGKERALKEIRYLAALNHPNLIQYYYAWNESPPIGWQEEEDKKLLVRTNNNKRDSISTFPTSAISGNTSESIHPMQRSKHPSARNTCTEKPSINSHLLLFEISLNHSSNPLRIDEDFSIHSDKNNDTSEISSSSNDKTNNNSLDSNNNTKLKSRVRSRTKSSVSSSSPLFDHSFDSSIDSEEPEENIQSNNALTESDDGIVFLHDEKQPSNSSPVQTQTKSFNEKAKSLTNEKDLPPTYFYFVMELCQPESLRDRLTRQTIDRCQAWSIFDQIIMGIEYIHSQKLIHRDLKPSNILFSMDNTVKIGDFGLVSAFGEDKLAKRKKCEDGKFDLTLPIETMSSTTDGNGNHELGGTMLYMSPEQMKREPYNQKVDIYAMGIILFELLYPFSTQMERMQAIANVRLPTPVFPVDFERDGKNRKQLIQRLISWLLSHSSHDRPRANELRQDTFYQRMLHLEVPHLFNSGTRSQSQTIANGQEQTPPCQIPQRGRISSSPFRRTVSSSVLQSHRESECEDI